MSFIPTVIAGLVFLWTGFLKAVSPRTFQAHLFQLGWIPARLINASVLIVVAAESALGTALVTGFHLHVTIPAAMLALAVLTASTSIAMKSGRTNDCGCYAGLFSPSLPQTLAINAALFLFLAFALVNPQRPALTTFQSTILVVGVTVAMFSLATVALRAWVMRGERFFDESPLQFRREWNNRWSASVDARNASELFVAYLGRDCPYCRRWIPVLNGIHESSSLPRVIGVVGESPRQAKEYQLDSGARFPLKAISRSLMSRLVDGVPTVVHVVDGEIADIWTGEISPTFLSRFKEAFFAVSQFTGRPSVAGGEPTGA